MLELPEEKRKSAVFVRKSAFWALSLSVTLAPSPQARSDYCPENLLRLFLVWPVILVILILGLDLARGNSLITLFSGYFHIENKEKRLFLKL